MFNWFKSKKSLYPIGTIIKFRRGKMNDLSERYVLGSVISCEISPNKKVNEEWGDFLGVQIQGLTRLHYIWTHKTKFMEVTDGERMLFKLENE